ncbi:hypothetical protein ACRRVD_02785 [Candidatus Cardinium hertigii]|uniref:hypothetical protein n=1 Tax=Candidatus Cardinium hertigii TaxID=247481 RepID=UPI003D7E0DC2
MIIYYYKKFHLMLCIGLSSLFTAGCSKYISKSAMSISYNPEVQNHLVKNNLLATKQQKKQIELDTYKKNWVNEMLDKVTEEYETNDRCYTDCKNELRDILTNWIKEIETTRTIKNRSVEKCKMMCSS